MTDDEQNLPVELALLGDEDFVSLTTFRRSGVGVPTAVWIVRGDGALLVTTSGSSGKVKRLRNNGAITLRPCSRSGQVADGAPTIEAHAEVKEDAEHRRVIDAALLAKYGMQFRAMQLAQKGGGAVQRLRRGSEQSGRSQSVVLRITPAPVPSGPPNAPDTE